MIDSGLLSNNSKKKLVKKNITIYNLRVYHILSSKVYMMVNCLVDNAIYLQFFRRHRLENKIKVLERILASIELFVRIVRNYTERTCFLQAFVSYRISCESCEQYNIIF